MPNIEKVIDGMRHCLGQTLESCNSCPYHRHKDDAESYNCQTMHREAIALLLKMKDIRDGMNHYTVK